MDETVAYEGQQRRIIWTREASVPCFFKGRDVVVTHGFRKRKQKMPPVELQRAKRIRAEYLAREEN